MTTEAEAKTKICPVLSIMPGKETISDPQREFPAQIVQVLQRHCRGSDCMMWRWDGWPGSTEGGKTADKQGHCGLSGGV